MSRSIVAAILVVCALTSAGCMTGQYAHYGRRPSGGDSLGVITNHDVIAMTQAGISDSVIVPLINVSVTEFRLRPRDVIALADSGVSDAVISAMIQSGTTGPAGDDGGEYAYGRPYYWYAGYPYWNGWDPWWYGWYPGLYAGYSPGFYRPAHFRYRSGFGPHPGFYGGGSYQVNRGSGGGRSAGRRR